MSDRRLNELDTLRSTAILLVFFYHYQVFVSGHATFGLLSRLGWAGAEHPRRHVAGAMVLAFYLVHKPIAMIPRRERPADCESESPRTIIVIFAASLLGGWLLHRLVEVPFMRLRKKIAPSNFAS